jgi:hypothetical protein
VNPPGATRVRADDQRLLSRAASWDSPDTFADLSVERLAAITATHGLDFATAVLHDRAGREPANAAFHAAVHAVPSASPAEAQPLADLIGIVPGAFHGQHQHTGADGVRLAAIVRGLAPRIELLPVLSFGPLDENARLILDWLEARRGQRIALASLSKGGADLKRALAAPRAAAAFAAVTAWVNFSGIVEGTPLVAWLRERPLRSAALGLLLRFQGNRPGVIDELRRSPSGPLARWPSLPSHLHLVHVNGCPLEHHLQHKWAPRGYARLAPLGPNDGGGILLGDLSRRPGIVYPIWGADHYLEPSWDATALLRSIVIAALRGTPRDHATQSAVAPIAAPATRSTT